mmetsp:Transcript_29984/g.35634  ORF Transcript_29984/g.35634 Transcript_29984/m.35634 type:complete len:226 (+) Transcript_29984:422-1099(+)|eukprot:CAMPEP_0198271956 /NCGR_PEP_ID=MMETSP1447-20131203/51195_1 /TAXON_ID=420782 /ORGANISM="Chaetoceros dichaeta, Strain CCMP1751" /LENGTH=225 /DNA_ID=CAMNT_0043964841 /DNA_START=363 /DNA_END=1040 /DNA_ORIENTATION=+
MRAFISSDDNLERYRHNSNDDGDDPLSPRLRAQFETLCTMQRQQKIQLKDEDDEKKSDTFLGIEDTSIDDDEYYEALFSSSSSCAATRMITDEAAITTTLRCHTSNGHKRRRIEESSPSLALSTSILAQREIDEVRNRIAELEDFLSRTDRKTDGDYDDVGASSLRNEEEEETDDGDGGRMQNPRIVAHDEIGMLNSAEGRHNTTVVRSYETPVAVAETTTCSPR